MDHDEPLIAAVHGSSVVLYGVRNVAVAMTPEAVLDSLEAMRAAANEAMRNRELGISPEEDYAAD